MPSQPSPNFAFLAYHDARLVALGTQAEQHFANDANVTLYKLRQFCEVLAKRAAAKVGLRAVHLSDSFTSLTIFAQAARLAAWWERIVKKSYRLKEGKCLVVDSSGDVTEK